MSWTQRHLHQTITHWPRLGNDGFGGSTYDSPRFIKGRWEDRSELFLDRQGTERRADSVVYLAEDIGEEDYLYNGESSVADPTKVTGAREVRSFQKLPDLRVTAYERKAIL